MLARKIRSRLAEFSSCFRVAYYRFMGITIGKKCFISSKAHIDIIGSKITIGDHVGIAGGTYILAHTAVPGRKELKETKIEDNVLIFVNAVIFPGVKVGNNSIVGAGSIVTKDVPPSVVVAGNPARIIRKLSSTKSLV